VLIALIAGLGGTWAVLRGLFLPAFAGTSGKEITGTDEPRLFAALREVSEVAGTRMVDRVYLEPGAEAAVRESGGVVRVLFGGGERVLHLGFWTLQGLTVGELKAILAHEYGHFAHGETRLTPVVSRIVNTLLGMLQRMAALGRSTWLNPVYWYLRVYFRIFLAVTSSHSRRSELLADRAAALAYGGDVFGKALRKAVENGDEFDRQAGKIAVLLRMGGRPCTGLYRALEAACALAPRKLRDGRLKQLLETEPGQFDSHPPAADRIARVAGVPGSHAAEDAPALSLLSDPEATAQLLATLVQSRIDAQLAARSELGKDQPMDPGAQVLFAEGLALHDAALALQGLKDPEGDAMLASAVERFEAALGPDDPILVVALKNLAVTQRRLGRKDEAMATLDRALAILVEHPDVDAERDLRGMMKELAAA